MLTTENTLHRPPSMQGAETLCFEKARSIGKYGPARNHNRRRVRDAIPGGLLRYGDVLRIFNESFAIAQVDIGQSVRTVVLQELGGEVRMFLRTDFHAAYANVFVEYRPGKAMKATTFWLNSPGARRVKGLLTRQRVSEAARISELTTAIGELA
jgi:hypothetical protein